MTKRIGNVVFVQKEKPQQCDECGKIDQVRPYGANGAVICFSCGTTEKHRRAVATALIELNRPTVAINELNRLTTSIDELIAGLDELIAGDE